MEKDLIDMMVDKFLSWPLPIDFAPDAGITFSPGNVVHGSPLWPVGTNLLTATQARQMVEHMLSGHTVYEMMPNAKSQATDAALSRHVACIDGLGGGSREGK